MRVGVGNCLHSRMGLRRCNPGGVSWLHSGRVLRNVEPVVEQSGNGDGSGEAQVKKRKKLKGKRAVVRWLKFFRFKKKKDYQRMTAEEKVLYKLTKVEILFFFTLLWMLLMCRFFEYLRSTKELKNVLSVK